MPGPVNIFNIGKSGLAVSKQAMNTTGHNIANVNTEGFSRQNLEITTAPVIANSRVVFGNGAVANKVTRVSDEFLEKRIQGENKNFAHAEEKDIFLQQTEQIFNESNSEGLNRLATRFFNEFRKLSTDPLNAAIRSSVRESSAHLANEIRRMDEEMKAVSHNIDSRIEGYVREVNTLAKEVRDLNGLIRTAELNGAGEPPDLLDKRDQALKKLSAMADISTSRDNHGQIMVNLSGQLALVAGETLRELDVARTPEDPQTGKKDGSLDIIVKGSAEPQKLTHMIKAGRLGALLNVRDKDIGGAQDQVNKIARLISSEVNNLHRQGYGLDGGTGRDFFSISNEANRAAASIRLSDHIETNLNAIAAAKEPGSEGDNRIAIALSGLGDLKGVDGDPNSSILDLYNGTVSGLAVKTGAAKKNLLFQKDVLSQLENVRESLVGVSLDEETANLVKFQHSYAASAKVLQVGDEAMQTIFNTFK